MPYTVIGAVGEVTIVDDTMAAFDNRGNILTLNNVAMLCGDCTLSDYVGGMPFAQFSEQAFDPAIELKVPVCVTSEGQTTIEVLTITPGGEIQLSKDYDSAIVHLSGIVMNMNSKYYTPEIGNIYDNSTSPLTES